MNQNIIRAPESFDFLSLQDKTLQSDRAHFFSGDRRTIPIYRYIEQYAQQSPESIAITFDNNYISYKQLNQAANQLAHYLLSQNVQPQDKVAVLVAPGAEILISILAIHKINAVYVPIDVEYPLARIKTITDLVAPSALISCSDRSAEIKASLTTNIINLAETDLSDLATSNPDFPCPPESVSHIFFTSGTTGTPKGVIATHSNLIHYIWAAQDKYHFSADDSFLAAARHTFSISLLMLLLPLVCGGTVNIITLEQLLTPELLAKAIESSTFFHLSPSLLKVLLDFLAQDGEHSERFNHVRHASSGGDMIPPEILNCLNQTFPQAEVYAIYGSTEISCMGCSYFVPKNLKIEQTLVGKPFNKVQLRVLNRHQQVLLPGVKGEICFAGAGITQGYLNLPDLTAAKYVLIDGQRFYRTGDIGRLTPQGDLQIIGREDNQVQIRGMRIELGEIEACLHRHPAVSNCVAIAKPDLSGEKQLIAYVIAGESAPISQELRSFLQQTLPQYMIPAHFVFVEQFPLNPNGKVDRRALSLLELKIDNQTHNLIQPRTATEQQLAQIWSEVLNLKAISIEDNFFDLGGHSLLATQIISRIREMLKVEISIASLFASPTIESLATQIDTASSKNSVAPILRVPRQEKIPLSLTQQRLWFLYQLEGKSSAYNIPLALEMKGVLQIKALKETIAEIVRRHEILRTNFELIDNTPVQVIHPNQDIPLKVVDLRSLSESERNIELQRLMETEVDRPFDLTQEALLRATLFQQTPNSQVLLINMHHIISDGWSLEVFVSELSAIYTAIVNQQPSPLPELSIQYADFAHWQREHLQREIFETQLDYWQQQLAGLPPLLELPTDKPRPAIQTFDGGIERFQLSSELTTKLQTISKESGATLFMTLLASFATLLSRYSNSQDLAIGSPIANRNRSALEPLIGFFVNTLVLRTNLEGEPSFKELLQRVRQTTLDAYAHQDIQFDKLVEILQPERSSSYNPLFQVMFVLQNGTVNTKETSSLTLTPLPVDQVTAQFDLTLSMEETPEGLMGFWQYNCDLFAAETIKRLAANFLVLLEQIVTYPEKPVAALPLLAEEERDRVLVKFNPQEQEYFQDCCIHELFEAQVELNPDRVAVVFEDQQLTYQELNEQANQVAHYLQQLGVQPEQMVGLCVERSLDTVIGILGILKAGGAYVPLDPAYPQERIAYSIADSQIAVLLTHQKHLAELPEHQAKVICFDRDRQAIANCSSKNPQSQVKSTNLAYVIYTSGSTGKPKGVLVPHLNVVRLFTATQDWYNFDGNDVWTLFHSYAFDFSVWELWGALIYGGKLIVVPYLVSRSPDAFYKLLAKEKVTVLNQTPSAFLQLIQVEESANLTPQLNLRYVIFGGEALELQSLKPWFMQHGDRQPQLVNMYGITETTVHVTYRPINMSDLEKPSSVIGCPIPDLQLYLLNSHLQPVPIGVAGEMYVAGAGLARGYLNREDLTKDRFIDNPFNDDPQSKLYKSGDLARYLSNGELEYLGRIDHQVKIRGFRIELGEIESNLSSHHLVKNCLVIAREDIPGDRRLAAYLVAEHNSQPTIKELRHFLGQTLPHYMIPSHFVILEQFPLTSNGKIDRRNLPAPALEQQKSTENCVSPRNELEQKLGEIWQEVLGIESISIDDNFFHLGGHSLLATVLSTKLEQTFNVKLPLAMLFQMPTIEQQASFFEQQTNSQSWSSLAPIQPQGSKPPIFLFQGVGIYYPLSSYLGEDQPIYGLSIEMIDDSQHWFERIEELVALYIQEIKTVQPQGPYYFGGISFGGMVALEAAQQLQAQGEKVALLALFDTWGPNAYVPHSSYKRFFTHLRKFSHSKLEYIFSKLTNKSNKVKQSFVDSDQFDLDFSHKHKYYQDKKEKQSNKVIQTYLQARQNYVPKIYSGKITLFKSMHNQQMSAFGDFDDKLGWGELAAGGLDIINVPGDHLGILKEPHVAILASKLQDCLVDTPNSPEGNKILDSTLDD